MVSLSEIYSGGNPPHLHENGVCPYGGGGTPQQSTYTPPSPKVNLETYPTQMNVGDSSGLKYSIENATDSRSTVSSSNEAVLRVNEDGTLSAVAAGTATITVSGSGVEQSFEVTVQTVPVSSVSVLNLPEELQLGLTSQAEYSCVGVPLFRRNGYRQSGGRKPLFRNRDTALN